MQELTNCLRRRQHESSNSNIWNTRLNGVRKSVNEPNFHHHQPKPARDFTQKLLEELSAAMDNGSGSEKDRPSSNGLTIRDGTT